MREVLFGLALLVAVALIVVGVSTFSVGVALIVAGLLLAPLSWLMLGDDGSPELPADDGVDL